MKNADLRILLDVVRREGGEISHTGGGHLLIVHPVTGERVISSSTNPRGRGTANFRAQLRRAGFSLSRRSKGGTAVSARNGAGNGASSYRLARLKRPTVEEVVEVVRRGGPEGVQRSTVAEEFNIALDAASRRLHVAETLGLVRAQGKTMSKRFVAVDQPTEQPVEGSVEQPQPEPAVVEAEVPFAVTTVQEDGSRLGGIGFDFVVEVAHEALQTVTREIEQHQTEIQRLSIDRERLERVVSQLESV